MIRIKYFGHSCFVLDFGGYKIALDPYTGVPGYKELSIEANEVCCSHGHMDHCYTEAVKIIPGKRPDGLKITEIKSFHDDHGGQLRGDNTLRIFECDGIRVMHCGDIGVRPADEQIAQMKDLDAVMIPVGGHFTFDAKQSADFLAEINPKVIIPMHYRSGACGYEVIATADEFLRLYKNVRTCESGEIEIGKDGGTMVAMLNFL